MKLDTLMMREAFANENWDTAAQVLGSVFSVDLDPYVLNVHKDADHYPEIVAYTSYNEYYWSLYSGFGKLSRTRFMPAFCINIYTSIKPWKF